MNCTLQLQKKEGERCCSGNATAKAGWMKERLQKSGGEASESK
jgi:hypothetical protein